MYSKKLVFIKLSFLSLSLFASQGNNRTKHASAEGRQDFLQQKAETINAVRRKNLGMAKDSQNDSTKGSSQAHQLFAQRQRNNTN